MRNNSTATITMLKAQQGYGFLLRQVNHVTERKADIFSRILGWLLFYDLVFLKG